MGNRKRPPGPELQLFFPRDPRHDRQDPRRRGPAVRLPRKHQNPAGRVQIRSLDHHLPHPLRRQAARSGRITQAGKSLTYAGSLRFV